MVHATADETFATSARVGDQAVEAAVEALERGAPVICDARMVVAGIPSVVRATDVLCYLDRVPSVAPRLAPSLEPPLAPSLGSLTNDQDARATRSAAAIDLAARDHGAGAIWVIGNAPTALARLVHLCRGGSVRPAAVIGLPVGYVGAAEAKQALWESDLRRIAVTNVGPRGGSSVAAAALNALARLAHLT
jgi:precorrin-8X/cobalt-precorrin-8 methylmutase